MKEVHKAISFRASSLGDCLMGKYFLENIHAAHPSARLALVVSSKGDVIRDLLHEYPWIEVIEASKRNIPGVLSLLARFFWSDIVVTQYAGKGGAFGTASKLIARLVAKPGGLVGFHDAWKFNALIYSKLLKFSMEQATVEHERDALKAAGVAISMQSPTYRIHPVGGLLEKLGLRRGGYIALHLFSGGIKRSLSPEKKKELVRAVLSAAGAVPVVLTASSYEAKEMREAAEGLSVIEAVCMMPSELAAVLEGAKRVVSLDTGAAHITAQLGKPLTVLGTCMGRPWWIHEQYPQNVPYFTRADLCPHGHVLDDYPACLNQVDMSAVAKTII